MSRQKSRRAAAVAARLDRRPIVAITAISVLISLVLALDLFH